MFLSFGNGKKIDLSMLKEGIDVQNDNFFKSYDKNNNSIFDADEIAKIQEDLTNAAGEDAVLSENEALSFYAKIMNKTVEQVQKLFKKEDNTNAYSSIEQLFVEQAENETKAKMQADVDKAIEIYNQAQGGVISKGCNNLKELFNTQYAGDKVYRQIMNKQVSAWLLEETDSNDGLTKKEFIERKTELLLCLLGGENLTDEELNSIRAGLLKSTEEELQKFLDRLINAENEEFPQVIQQTISELDKKTKTLNNQETAFNSINPKSLEAILNGKEGEKKLDFQAVFHFENGVEFNKENILDAKNKAQIASINLSVSLKINSLREGLKNPALGLSLAISQPSTPESVKEQKYSQLSDTILNTLKEWLGNDEQKIADAIKTYGGSAAQIKNGKIVFETNLTGKAGNSAEMLVALANNISNSMYEKLEDFLGDKSLEEYLAESDSADKKAYGDKNPIDIAEKFQESQFKMLGGVKFGIMGASAVVAVLSDGLAVPIIASITGGLLSVGVSALDTATDANKYTEEDKETIKQELIMNGVFQLVGGAIGKASASLGQLAKSVKCCPKFCSFVAEYGSDAAMSLLADLAITGEIDLKGEGLSQLMNIAMGVIAGAKVQKAGAGENKNMKKNESDTGGQKKPLNSNKNPNLDTQISLEVEKYAKLFEININKQADNVLTSIFSSIKEKTTSMQQDEKLRFILDYVTRNNFTQDISGKNKSLNQNLLGDRLLSGSFDCKEKTLLLKLILDELDIHSEIKVGTYKDCGHTWIELDYNGKKCIFDSANAQKPLSYKNGVDDSYYKVDESIKDIHDTNRTIESYLNELEGSINTIKNDAFKNELLYNLQRIKNRTKESSIWSSLKDLEFKIQDLKNIEDLSTNINTPHCLSILKEFYDNLCYGGRPNNDLMLAFNDIIRTQYKNIIKVENNFSASILHRFFVNITNNSHQTFQDQYNLYKIIKNLDDNTIKKCKIAGINIEQKVNDFESILNDKIREEDARVICEDKSIMDLAKTNEGTYDGKLLILISELNEYDISKLGIKNILKKCNDIQKLTNVLKNIKQNLKQNGLNIDSNGTIIIENDTYSVKNKYGNDIVKKRRKDSGHEAITFYKIEELINLYLIDNGKYMDDFCKNDIISNIEMSRGASSLEQFKYNMKSYEELIELLVQTAIKNPPTQEQYNALCYYKGYGYDSINSGKAIREGNILEKYLSTNILKKPITVRRNDDLGGLVNIKFSDGTSLLDVVSNPEQYKDKLSNINSLLKGSSYINDRFVSTTGNLQGIFEKPVTWELNIQEGVGVASMDILSLNPEAEVLLNRGLKYTIEEVKIDNGFVFIKAKVEMP